MTHDQIKVSILVFLDSLLQQNSNSAIVASANKFQSLFFWIHFYNTTAPTTLSSGRCRFQSLFFWIHFYNPNMTTWPSGMLLCFNPCFSGFTSTTHGYRDPFFLRL